jgi:hypothetical protein
MTAVEAIHELHLIWDKAEKLDSNSSEVQLIIELCKVLAKTMDPLLE